MAKLDEFNSPKENLGADPQREFDSPAELYGPGQPEYVPPETPDGIPVRKKKTSRMLITAIMSLSLLTAPVLDEAVASHAQSAPQPTRPAAVEETLPSSTDQPPLQTEVPDTQPPQTEPEKTDLEILLEVGTWVSEDGLLYARFDEGGNGWWRTAKNGNTYARMAWQEQDGRVHYSGHAASPQVIPESDDSYRRAMVYSTVEGTVGVSDLTVQLENPLGMACTTYVPAEPVELAQPYEFYDTALPGTVWQQAAFSTVPQDVAAAEEMPVVPLRYYVWVERVSFTEDTCTVTYGDNRGGRQDFIFGWEQQEGDRILLTPQEELRYTLQDAAENSTMEYSCGTRTLQIYTTAGESGPVVCVENPFARLTMNGLDFEYLSLG